MKPHLLIKALVERAGGALPVATAMGAKSFQGTLWKICEGQVASPSRASAERIAKHFSIPVDAIYNEKLAAEVWRDRFSGVVATNPPAAQPTEPTPSFGGAQTKGWLAHSLSQATPMMEPPTISWGSIIDTVLPSEFKVVIGDDSMAKEFPKGCTIVFSTTEGKPRAGDAVLVADGDNNVFFREYQERRPGHWQAVALNTIYQPLDSRADGLRVLAIKVGSWGRRG